MSVLDEIERRYYKNTDNTIKNSEVVGSKGNRL
jgi:hypothetical protein